MEDEMLPAPSKKRMKRLAAKKLRKEAKKALSEQLLAVPGPDTITEAEVAETTSYTSEGTSKRRLYACGMPLNADRGVQ